MAQERKKRVSKRKREGKRRDGQTPCGAAKKNGLPCLQPAGWGTDHPGTGRCSRHGGNVPSHKAKAARVEASAFGTAIEVAPEQAVLGVIRQTAGQLAYATWKVNELPEHELREDGTWHHWVAAQHQLQSRLVTYSEAATRMGVAERMVNLQEQQTELMARIMEGVLKKVGATAEQRAMVGPAIREVVAEIDSGETARQV